MLGSWVYILKMEPTGFLERLNVRSERKGVNETSRFLTWATGGMKLSTVNMGKGPGGIDLREIRNFAYDMLS